jgi:hypothetical protein
MPLSGVGRRYTATGTQGSQGRPHGENGGTHEGSNGNGDVYTTRSTGGAGEVQGEAHDVHFEVFILYLVVESAVHDSSLGVFTMQ